MSRSCSDDDSSTSSSSSSSSSSSKKGRDDGGEEKHFVKGKGLRNDNSEESLAVVQKEMDPISEEDEEQHGEAIQYRGDLNYDDVALKSEIQKKEGNTAVILSHHNRHQASSRFFEPYRTIGITTSGRGFFLQQGVEANFLAVPIGDRFQVLNCDKLAPVLVSGTVPVIEKEQTRRKNKQSASAKRNKSSKKVQISQIVSDMNLRIALSSHDNCVTLYKRMIHPIQSQAISKFPIQHMINIGKGKQVVAANEEDALKEHKDNMNHVDGDSSDEDDHGDNEMVDSTLQTALLVAVVCSPGSSLHSSTNKNKVRDSKRDHLDVQVVGTDDTDSDTSMSDGNESDSSSDDSDNSDSSAEDYDSMSSASSSESSNNNKDGENESDPSSNNQGEIVLLRIRQRIEIIRRIPLPFAATVTLHPDTYFNKIVVGGPAGQLALVNVNTSKVIHVFQCTLPKSLESSKAGATSFTVQPGSSSEKREENEDEENYLHDIKVLTQSPALDTIAVGTSGGMVHLVNLKFDALLFTLEHVPAHMKNKSKKLSMLGGNSKYSGAADSVAITSLSFRTDGFASAAQIAPMAVGRSDGTISVWDLNTTEENPHRRLLYSIENCHLGGVASCLFLPLEPVLVTSGKQDNCIAMHVFDAPDHSSRVLRSRVGHASPPTFCRYLHPAVGSTLGDSKSDGTSAELCQILSGGSVDRTVRLFSTARSVLDREFSQGPGIVKKAKQLGLNKRDLLLPPLSSFVTCEARSRDWGDTVTIHRHHAHAYVWSTRTKSQSGPVLRQDNWNVSQMKKQPPSTCHASCVAISACGHFCLVGNKGGTIYKYNLQSGMPRGSYPSKDAVTEEVDLNRMIIPGSLDRTMKMLGKKMEVGGASNLEQQEISDLEASISEKARQQRKLAARHNAAVIGVAVDSLNQSVFSVSSDGAFLVWQFKTHAPHKKSPVQLSAAGANAFCHVRESDLAAVALNDFSIVVVDCAALNVVRRLGISTSSTSVTPLFGRRKAPPSGHTGPISDMGFGPDGRRLYTSSLDATIRVWDVPTGACVDWLAFQSPPTSLTLSPTGEFLVTSHVDSVGLSMWCDKSFFQQVFLDGSAPLRPFQMDAPKPMSEAANDVDQEKRDLLAMSQTTEKTVKKVTDKGGKRKAASNQEIIVPKQEGLITMSGLPVGHWKNLFHLELVKERNKPKEAPQKPPSAPFFLQWRQGENIASVADKTADNAKDARGTPDQVEDGGDKWNTAWSDDEQEDSTEGQQAPNKPESRILKSGSGGTKRKAYQRSVLATSLQECQHRQTSFQSATELMADMGPSAIDMAMTELCYGSHDIEGIELLILASKWLLEACQSRQRFEAVNAYLNRFLYLHASTIAGIEDTHATKATNDENGNLQKRGDNYNQQELLAVIQELQAAQREAAEVLRGKMQHTLCLLGHFSMMVQS